MTDMDKSRVDWPSFLACIAIILVVCVPLGTWKTYISLKAVSGTVEFQDVKMTHGAQKAGDSGKLVRRAVDLEPRDIGLPDSPGRTQPAAIL